MGQQVSVETFSSTADSNGNKYWTNFDPYPFKVGHRKLAYMGMLNGSGPLKGRKCVVKTPRHGALNRKEWMLEGQRSQIAMGMANEYNKMVSGKKYKLSVVCPITAEIDSLSDCMCINDILGKPNNKMKETDFVSIELYLKGRFEEFEYGWVDPKELLVPEAFSHFTWCRSGGSFLVSNLQGVKTTDMYHFTSPVLHSENKHYGKSDLGNEGIKGFFRLHKCSRICYSWPRLGDGTDLRGWGEFAFSRGRASNAPPMLMAPPPYHEVQRAPSYEELTSMASYYNQSRNNFQTAAGSQERFQPNTARLDHRMLGFGDLQLEHQQEQRTTANGQRCDEENNQQTRHTHGSQGMMLNWREMTRMFGTPVYSQYNNNQEMEMQFMWFVKFMRGYSYNAPPPPPYCTCAERHIDYVQGSIPASVDNEYGFEDDDDEKYLLPPPYTEESVDPSLECITYL